MKFQAGPAGLVGREVIRLAPFLGLSLASGAAFDLIGTGATLVLRARGVQLADVGWLQLIYLPVGLAFLWAPIVDRWRPLPLPHRSAWIVGAQLAAAGLLSLLASQLDGPVAMLVAIGLGLSIVLSTTDIAVQALVVDTVSTLRRAPVSTARLVGSAIGSSIGIGLATSFARDALPQALLIVAAINSAVSVPFLFARERTAQMLIKTSQSRHSLRWRKLLGGGAAIGSYCVPAIMLGTVPGLFLLDLGLPLPATGAVTGAASTVITISMMLLSSYVLIKMPIARQILVMGAGVTTSGITLVLAAKWHWIPLAVVAVLIEDACDAGLNVPIAVLTYRWAEGAQVATDYAVLSGIAFFVSFPMRVGSPMVAAAIGWPAYFAISTSLYALSMVALRRADLSRES